MRHVALSLCLAILPAFAQAQSVPVMAGQHSDLDACAILGQVAGLDPNGDGFLAVRSGPGTQFPTRDRVFNGQPLWFCDERGPWIGVVYAPQTLEECGVTSPWLAPAAYSGPCMVGWVHRNWVQVVAG